MGFLCITFLWLAFTAPAHALTIETGKLDNGLQIVVLPNHRAPIVTQMIWYRVGAMDEKLGQGGLAHMLEHMMFKGTRDVPAGKFSETIAQAGGNENAFTANDFTAYFQTIAIEHLPLTLRLEADRMQNLVLADQDLHSERQVVIEERKSRTDNNPDAIWYEALQAALYRNHPYGRPIIGWREEIDAYTIDALRDFYSIHYAPNNAVLVLAGDVTLATAQPLIEKYFGAIPARATPERHPIPEPVGRVMARIDYSSARVQQAQFLRLQLAQSHYYPTPNTTADERLITATTNELLAQILGGGRDGMLYKELVTRQNLALSASVDYNGTRNGPGQFTFSLTPKDGVPRAKAVATMDRYLRSLSTKPLPADIIDRAKNQFIAATIYAQDNNFHLAYVVGEVLHRYADIRDGVPEITQWDERVRAITPAQLQAALLTLLENRTGVEGWLLPERSDANPASTIPAPRLPHGGVR